MALRLIATLILTGACFMWSAAHMLFAEDKPSQFSKEVSIDWEAVDGAKFYEVELSVLEKEDAKPTVTRVKTSSWTAKLPVGKYALRLRAFDARGVPGQWSDPQKFSIVRPSVILVRPQAGEKMVPDKESGKTHFEWKPYGEKAQYKLQLFDQSGKVTLEFKTGELHADVMVAKDGAYTCIITPLDKDGNELGSVDSKTTPFTVEGPQLMTPELTPDSKTKLSWNQLEGMGEKAAMCTPFTVDSRRLDPPALLKGVAGELRWSRAPEVVHFNVVLTKAGDPKKPAQEILRSAVYKENAFQKSKFQPGVGYCLSVRAEAKDMDPSRPLYLYYLQKKTKAKEEVILPIKEGEPCREPKPTDGGSLIGAYPIPREAALSYAVSPFASETVAGKVSKLSLAIDMPAPIWDLGYHLAYETIPKVRGKSVGVVRESLQSDLILLGLGGGRVLNMLPGGGRKIIGLYGSGGFMNLKGTLLSQDLQGNSTLMHFNYDLNGVMRGDGFLTWEFSDRHELSLRGSLTRLLNQQVVEATQYSSFSVAGAYTGLLTKLKNREILGTVSLGMEEHSMVGDSLDPATGQPYAVKFPITYRHYLFGLGLKVRI